MKVSGFTIVRNAVKYDYPVVESILSILPVCDEMIVSVGNSEDNTRKLIEEIGSSKIKIIDSVWDDSLREGGRVLAIETDKAKAAASSDSDWLFYIQADEMLHEQYHEAVRHSMRLNLENGAVEGLLFDYTHFYGSYDYVGESNRWYRHEIRVIRNRPDIHSYGDAQGFRKSNGEKLRVKPANAQIYHYGWVKHPKTQQLKQENFNKLWHDDKWVEEHIIKADEFDYSNVDSLEKFTGTHPEVMHHRVESRNWKFEYDVSYKKYKSKEKISRFIENITGKRIGEYKNYILID